ncbi:MAG TPA: hypothetical protein VGL65_07950 [Gemmatimonadales bacterium]|jgi:hypothetical protein
MIVATITVSVIAGNGRCTNSTGAGGREAAESAGANTDGAE